MRVVIVGASDIGVAFARRAIEKGEEVVLIDRSRERLEELGSQLDCGMLHGDGTDPDILRDALGEQGGTLCAVTAEDQDNILSCLLAHSLGFERVLPRIGRPHLFAICDELGLAERISPEEEIAQSLMDKLYKRGDGTAHALQWPAQLFSFTVRSQSDLSSVADVKLPSNSRVICIFRGDSYVVVDQDHSLKEGDRVVVITDAEGIDQLTERYSKSKV
jgi:trk/ktr system potassium uptake protein